MRIFSGYGFLIENLSFSHTKKQNTKHDHTKQQNTLPLVHFAVSFGATIKIVNQS